MELAPVVTTVDVPTGPLAFAVVIFACGFIAATFFCTLVLVHFKKPEVSYAVIMFVPIQSAVGMCCAICGVLISWNLYYGRAYGGDPACRYWFAIFQAAKNLAVVNSMTLLSAVRYIVVIEEQGPSHSSLFLGVSIVLVVSFFIPIVCSIFGLTGGIFDNNMMCSVLRPGSYIIYFTMVFILFFALAYTHYKQRRPNHGVSFRPSAPALSIQLKLNSLMKVLIVSMAVYMVFFLIREGLSMMNEEKTEDIRLVLLAVTEGLHTSTAIALSLVFFPPPKWWCWSKHSKEDGLTLLSYRAVHPLEAPR